NTRLSSLEGNTVPSGRQATGCCK
ncbi:Protein of unknown function, partial [Gryllus bimaculatus]